MRFALSCFSAAALAAMSSSGWAQSPAYHYVYRPVQVPQEVTAYKVEYETVYKPEVRTSYRQVVETSEHERRYTVQKPFYETAEQDVNEVTYEPQTTYVMRQQDQGGWETRTVLHPGAVSSQLTWRPAGYAVDPVTGAWYWQLGGFAWVQVQGPPVQQTQTVWRPNIVCTPVPQTTYVQKVITKKVPVQVLKYRTEEVVEKVPVQVYKTVPVQETVQVAHVQEKIVPVKYTQWVQKLELVKVPVDPCTCQPIGVLPGPVSSGGLSAPSLPAQTEAKKPVGGTPTDAEAAQGKSPEKSVVKDEAKAPETAKAAEATKDAAKADAEWKQRLKKEEVNPDLNGPKAKEGEK